MTDQLEPSRLRLRSVQCTKYGLDASFDAVDNITRGLGRRGAGLLHVMGEIMSELLNRVQAGFDGGRPESRHGDNIAGLRHPVC